MNNYFIIHGFMGSNIENWFPWLKEQIDNNIKNATCIIPQFPIEVKYHNYKNWKKLLNTYCKFNLINENTTIIAHSTGCIFVLKYLLEYKIKVKKLILVSGFNNYFPEGEDELHRKLNPTYFVKNNKLSKIKKYVDEIICIYGDNDPYIDQITFHNFSNNLDAKEIIIKNGGHLNKSSGFIEFKEIIEYI